LRFAAAAGSGVVPRFVEIVPGLNISPGIFKLRKTKWERQKGTVHLSCLVEGYGKMDDGTDKQVLFAVKER
jgi:hypothetical protein